MYLRNKTTSFKLNFLSQWCYFRISLRFSLYLDVIYKQQLKLYFKAPKPFQNLYEPVVGVNSSPFSKKPSFSDFSTLSHVFLLLLFYFPPNYYFTTVFCCKNFRLVPTLNFYLHD
uniref:Uncharacterized protein n=1 Tax=Cacopsylla melanoneura TaxID=428564 RepID=A0A8D9E1K5_9HEMI